MSNWQGNKTVKYAKSRLMQMIVDAEFDDGDYQEMKDHVNTLMRGIEVRNKRIKNLKKHIVNIEY